MSDLDGVLDAAREVERARTHLQDAVDRARAGGASWVEVGHVLGVTRQAAFKRFGHPRDVRDGTPVKQRGTDGVVTLTEGVFALLDAGDHAGLRRVLDDGAAAVLTEDRLLSTWTSVVADVGHLVACRGTHLELPDGSPVKPGEQVHGTLVGATTLELEAGERHGRVAVGADGLVTGILVVPVDPAGRGPLPF